MKHIFVVYSPITYLVTLSTISHLRLDKNEYIIFGKDWGYNVENVYDFTKELTLYRRIRFYFNIPKLYDFILKKYIGDDKFICYIPMVYDFPRFLITHPNCTRFNFIEEGAISYVVNRLPDYQSYEYRYFTWRDRLFSKNRLKSVSMILRGQNLKLLSWPLYYESYVNCRNIDYYCLSEESFPLAKEKNVVSIKSAVKDFRIESKCSMNEDEIIFISDDAVETYDYPIERYLSLVEDELIKYLLKINRKKILLKLHPRELPYKIKEVENLFDKNGIEYSYINKDVILEIDLEAIPYQVTMIGFDSTLLLYGAFAGHTAYSIPREINRFGVGEIPVFDKKVKRLNV